MIATDLVEFSASLRLTIHHSQVELKHKWHIFFSFAQTKNALPIKLLRLGYLEGTVGIPDADPKVET